MRFQNLANNINQLTQRQVYLILIIIFGGVLFLNGITPIPYESYQRLSQNPFVTRTDIDPFNYLQETVLLPVFAHLVHMTSRNTFNLLCFGIFVLGVFLFAKATLVRYGTVVCLLGTSALIVSPLSTVILSWLGSPDSLSFALMVPFLFLNSSFWLFLLAVLGTLNHTAFIIAVAEIILLRWLSRETIKFSHFVITMSGGLTGYFLVKLFLALNHIHAYSRLDYIFVRGFDFWVAMNNTNFGTSMFSLYNFEWLVVAYCVVSYFKADRFYYLSVVGILICNCAITFFTEDTTRVFLLMSWGILIMILFHTYELALMHENGWADSGRFLLFVLVIVVVTLVAPRFFSWQGRIYLSPFYNQLLLAGTR